MVATEGRNDSPSPTRQSFGNKFSSLGAKITRTFSSTHSNEDHDSVASDLPVLGSQNRSQSRGREAYQSTGRGGLGNIRTASQSRDRPTSGPDDFSVTRGREPISNPTAVYSTGRGGAGNLRSPSRDASRGPDLREREVIDKYVSSHQDAAISTGRGGIGNINRSRSRDPSSTGHISTGRGGVGNIIASDGYDGYDANAADEKERKKHEVHLDGFHSTGRGGVANITLQEEPSIEHPSIPPNEYESTGRGGVGNIHREHDLYGSRD